MGGIREAIRPGEHGLLVAAGDAGRLAEALAKLLRDDELRARLGAAARERARRHYTVEVMADAYEALYRGAAHPPERPADS